MTQRTYDFNRSNNDPRVKLAESRVMDALRHLGWEVQDHRLANEPGDFFARNPEAGAWFWRVDVKFDKYMDDRDTIPFERFSCQVDNPDNCWQGWGPDKRLDYIAVVGLNLAYARLIRMHPLRVAVAQAEANGETRAWECRPAYNVSPRGDYRSHLWAIPFHTIQQLGAFDRLLDFGAAGLLSSAAAS